MLHEPENRRPGSRNIADDRPLSDAEWRFIEPFVVETLRRPGRPPRDHRQVLDGVFWIACSGSPWRGLPKHYGNWGSVYRQFLRWTRSGLWTSLAEALDNTGERKVDAATLGAYIEAARQVALRPRSTQGRMRAAAE